MEKLDAIERAQQAIVRAQGAVVRCRAALERTKDITAQKRLEYQGLRAKAEENMVRTEILKTGQHGAKRHEQRHTTSFCQPEKPRVRAHELLPPAVGIGFLIQVSVPG